MPITTEPTLAEQDGKVDLSAHFNLLQTAHDSNDRRLVARVLHSLPKVRKSLDVITIVSIDAFSIIEVGS